MTVPVPVTVDGHDGGEYDSDDKEEEEEGPARRVHRQRRVEAIADDITKDWLNVSGRTLREWAKEFREKDAFTLDGRGL